MLHEHTKTTKEKRFKLRLFCLHLKKSYLGKKITITFKYLFHTDYANCIAYKENFNV